MSSVLRTKRAELNGYLGLIGNTPSRIYPIDDYKPHFDKILPRASEYHFLWMPLMGQHHSDPALQMRSDLCGKTSQAMVYNFFQLAMGGDPSKNYITHWTADKPGFRIDPRFPNGDRAFSLVASSDPAATGSNGGTTGIGVARSSTRNTPNVPENYSSLPLDGRGISALLHYDGVQVLPFGSVRAGDRPGLKARADLAASIARDDAFKSGCPDLFTPTPTTAFSPSLSWSISHAS